MSAEKVSVVVVDPYHKVYGMLVPALIQRLLEAVEAFGDGSNTVVEFMTRLHAGDKGAILLAAVTPAGKVKGYAAAGTNGSEVIMIQPRLDEPTSNDAIAEMIERIEEWAKSLGAKRITLISKRLDPKWQKKYDFDVARYVLTKELAE